MPLVVTPFAAARARCRGRRPLFARAIATKYGLDISPEDAITRLRKS